MPGRRICSIALFFMVLPSAAAAADPKPVVEVLDLHPFSNIAYLPAGAVVSSVKFESLKAVQVPTKRIATVDKYYCEQGSQEPGGSAPCPSLRDVDPQPAYRIDYSFQGEPMSSDEYGGTRFTFSVYFRPDDLDAGLRQTIREGHIKKVDLERFFVISTDRGSVPVLTLDTATSSLCEGNYVDGHWTRTDRACEEKLTYKTAMRPSQYIAVKVTPISPAQKQFASK